MADGESLRNLGEHVFLARLCQRLRGRPLAPPGSPLERASSRPELVVGPGDDAAVLRIGESDLALTTDALVEGAHFMPGWLEPDELGSRAIAVAVSDLAAMGAQPIATLVSLTLSPETPAATLDALLDSCARASEGYGAMMIGGNLARADTMTITVTAIGEVVGRCLLRSGAKPGDRLVVTGSLGDAAAAVAAWRDQKTPPAALRARFAKPEARIAAGIALAAAGAHAAIDVSDGLLADLGHLCRASQVGAEVEWSRLPRSAEVAALDAAGAELALTGGEDYELLVACPPEISDEELERIAAQAGVPLTVTGRCTPSAGRIEIIDADGRPHETSTQGFDHFAARPSGGL